ncbi:MAG: serine hydrolase [Actinomycetota bacterium]|jgi:CubicO group peptidase (beta-lactamase class C family)
MTHLLDAAGAAADVLFADDAPHGRSLALLVQQGGEVVFERYGTQPDTLFGPGSPVDANTTLISWSMAKSITHAALGMAVLDGLLDVNAPAPVPEWQGTDKAAITLLQLLEMRSGLEFVEDYVDDSVSHCIEMLFGAGVADTAAYAASQRLIHVPGEVFNYSSGTTNIVSRILGASLGGGQEAMEHFLRTRLFEPLGMHSAVPKFDDAGTFIGSSYVYATANDFARFGQFYLDDGVVDGVRLLPEGWREHARTWSAHDPDGFDYGRHWWLWPEFPGVFAAHGYEGQYTVVWPERGLVLVHLGKSPYDQRQALNEQLRSIVAAAAAG